MQEVKIVACSDLHGIASFEKVAERAIQIGAQIVVVAGDVQTSFIGKDPASAFFFDFIDPTIDLLKSGIDVVLVPGNHDFYLREKIGYGRKKWKNDLCNLHVLCDQAIELCGLKFYGTPWCPWINGRWCYEDFDYNLDRRFKRIPSGVDILVSHTPPFGENDEKWDVSLQNPTFRQLHYGSVSLRNVIERRKPRCVICGHIHTGSHSEGSIGETVVINVSLLNERYEEAFDPSELVFGSDGKINTNTSGE